MERHFLLFALILAFTPGTSSAGTVTEAEYLLMFGAEHPAAVALSGPLAAARGLERSAGALLNPVLEVDHEAPGEARQLTTTIGWTPPVDGRRGLGKQAARAGVEAAQGELTWSLLELRAEVRGLYAEWALAVARESLLVSQVAVFRVLVQRADERRRVGEESGLTAQRLGLELVELEANVARAGAERSERTRAALGRALARHENAEPVMPSLPTLPTAIDLQLHPLLEARRANVEAAQASARLSGRLALAPHLRLGWQTQHERDSKADGLVLGGTWAFPMFDRQQGARLEAEGRLRATQAALEVEDASAQSQLAGSRESYVTLRDAALRATASLQESGRVIERSAAKFQMGESNVTDLLDAMRSVLSARMTALDLHGAALEAHRKLELAAGRPLMETPGGGR